jgi:hypothetical protein
MSERGCGITAARVLLWIARLAGTAAVVPLMLIAFGERGSGCTWRYSHSPSRQVTSSGGGGLSWVGASV